MKVLLVFLIAVPLVSCNTMIGLGRDTKKGYQWTKRKIQDSRQPQQQSDPYGAPVY